MSTSSNKYFGSSTTIDVTGLTQHEIEQIEHIGTNAISTATWNYLSSINQGLSSISSPSFSRLLLQNGLSTSPAISFSSDADTGIYSTGVSGEIGISSNNVLKLQVSPAQVRVTNANLLCEGANFSVTDGLTDAFTVKYDTGVTYVKGNLGIKKAAGTAALEVNGDVIADNYKITIDDYGVALGFDAGYGTPYNNVCIGHFAGGQITSGLGNTCVGTYSGNTFLTTGSNNILIGNIASVVAGDTSNAIVIGYDNSAATNEIVIGNASHVSTRLYGKVGINQAPGTEQLEVNGSAVIKGACNLDYNGPHSFALLAAGLTKGQFCYINNASSFFLGSEVDDVGIRQENVDKSIRFGCSSGASTLNVKNGKVGINTNAAAEALEVSGNLLFGSATYKVKTVTSAITTANKTLTFPNANVDLQYVPTQNVNSTSSVQFSKIGVNQSPGTERVEVTGSIKCTVNMISAGALLSGLLPGQVGDTPLVLGASNDYIYLAASSQRFKDDIVAYDGDPFVLLEKLKPKTYYFKTDIEKKIKSLGLIAEDVEKVDKQYVSYIRTSDQPQSVTYDRLVVPLIAGVVQLKKRIEELEKLNK